MLTHLSFEAFLAFAKDKAKRIAVFKQIPAQTLSPLQIYHCLQNAFGKEITLLENLDSQSTVHYSYFGFVPLASLIMKDDDKRDPIHVLRAFHKKFNFTTAPEVASLISSSMGFLSYDFVRFFETIPDRHAEETHLPVLLFHAYQISITYDHQKHTILISVLTEVSDQPAIDYQQAQEKIENIINIFYSHAEIKVAKKKLIPKSIKADVTDYQFKKIIQKAKRYIKRGDVFQVVLSRCFKQTYTVAPFEIYTALRKLSPSPFMFYFPLEKGALVGASPERMLRVQGREVTINPIAGTRKRSQEMNDDAIAVDLLNDPKELAEHMMLVDLGRNDIGAVSEPGSIKIASLKNVKHYSHVSHITSTLIGRLRDHYDVFDALKHVFPAGTLSGAPKIRAMQIINELETSNRGVYGGAICRMDGLGNFDSNIAIRMTHLHQGVATIRAGAGIVYDSNPQTEIEEIYHKSQSILRALHHAHGTCL